MSIQKLKQALEQERIRPTTYDLEGGHQSERFTLARRGNNWVFYYSERGEEQGLKVFSSESAACEYFLKQILNDHVVLSNRLKPTTPLN